MIPHKCDPLLLFLNLLTYPFPFSQLMTFAIPQSKPYPSNIYFVYFELNFLCITQNWTFGLLSITTSKSF